MTDQPSAFPSLPPTGPLPQPGFPAGPPTSTMPWYRRRWWKLPVWAWISIAIVLIAAGAVGGKKQDDDATAGATTVDASATLATDGPATGTDAAVATDAATTAAPSTTRATTTTLATTTTSTLPPTTVPPQPVVFSGRGADVVELPDTSLVVATITHTGRANFVIWSLGADLEQTDLLVNVIGSYSGRVPVNMAGDTTALQVEADGDWTISLLPITHDVRLVGSAITGVGDDVLFLDETAVYAVTHTGTANFVVWVYAADSTDLAVNEIGAYSGNLPLRGPAFVVINADGAWSITKS